MNTNTHGEEQPHEIIDLREDYFKVSNRIFSVIDSPQDIAVYVCLCRHANNVTTKSWPSKKRISEMCQLSERAVFNSLKTLEERKVIKKIVYSDGRSNRYFLLPIQPSKEEVDHALDAYPHAPSAIHHAPDATPPPCTTCLRTILM